MTDEQKKMKRYVNAIERHLNLPSKIKVRVMSDLHSAITARREAGLTDDEIYAELGTPKKAAADLNEQMREYSYRKSPWRFLVAAIAVYGAVRFLDKIWTQVVVWWATGHFSSSEAASIGIIGGADGPTAIFVTTPVWTHWIVPFLLLILGILGYLRLRKCKLR